MNYYLKRRLQSGLTKSDMAKELSLNYIYYSAIERGDVKMPSNLINKFNEIINRGKGNEIKKTENEIKADEFWREVSQLTADNTYVLHDKMKEFNIPSLKVLVELLGDKSVGTLYNYLEGRNPVGVEFKKRLYNFFSNELNVQIPTKVVGSQKNGAKRMREPIVNKELDKYYQDTDFRKILRDNQITNTQIGAAIGTHGSVISRMTSKKAKPSYRVIQGVKDYLDTIVDSNKKVDSNEKIKKFEYKHSKSQLNFFNSFYLIEWLKEQEITPTEFAIMSGLSEGSIYNFDSYKNTNRIPMAKTIDAVKKAVEKYQNKNNFVQEPNTSELISKQKLIEECEKEIAINNQKIEELTSQIKELESKNELSQKFISLVQAIQ